MVKDIQPWKKQLEPSIVNKYKIVFKSKFKTSWKRYSGSGKYDSNKFNKILYLLATGSKLDSIYRDHELKGNMTGFRECHMESDLLLIYEIIDDELILDNIGTHSDLFGR